MCPITLWSSKNLKRCSKCAETKPTEDFYAEKHSRDGRQHYCKSCSKAVKKADYQANIEARRASGRQHYRETAGTLKAARRRLRADVIAYYSNGTMMCACCEESIFEFLTIDHIHGGGNKHKRSINRSHLYSWLAHHGYPSGFRVLCWNCNSARGAYGYCPHDKAREQCPV